MRISIIATLGGLAILSIWLSIFLYAEEQRQIAFSRAHRGTANLAIAFEQHLVSILDSVDQQTLVLKRQFERDPVKFRLNDALLDLPALVSFTLQIGMVDKFGYIVETNLPVRSQGLYVADRRHFNIHLEEDLGRLYVSAPVFARTTGRQVIQVSRRLNDRDGAFAGVLVVSLDPNEISGFFKMMDLGAHGMIAVVNAEGEVLARGSTGPGGVPIGGVMGGLPSHLKGTEGVYVAVDDVDRIERVISYRDLPAYPLYVLVGVAVRDLLISPERQARFAGIGGLAATVLITALCLVLAHSARVRHREATALQARARRFQDFTHSAGEWQWETDAEGRYRWFSDSANSVTGADFSFALGRRREDFAADLSDPIWRRHAEVVGRREAFRDFIGERVLPSGERRYVRSSGVPVFDESGTFCGYRGVASDVTAERNAAFRLKQIENRLLGVTNNMPGIVHQTHRDADGANFRYTYLSGRVREYFGCAPEEVYEDPTRMHRAIHPDDLPAVHARTATPPQTEHPWSWEYRVIVDGKIRWLRGTARSHREEDGSIVSDGVVIDVTEIKDREQEILVARRQAEAANSAKASFLAHVSHELRTPLNAIMGYAEVIRDRLFGPEDSRYPEYAAHIHDSGAHLLSIINDLLDLSRIDAGRVELEESDTEIEPLIEDSLTLVRALADARSIRIYETIAVQGKAWIDRRRISQALINLLSNAVKFSKPGGEVRLSARLNPKRRLVIQVEDDGPGMSEQERAAAFEPFRRGDATVRGAVEGTGLGLPICRRLMEMHGGAAEVESRPGEGVRATLTLPAARCRALSSLARKQAPSVADDAA
ncbi:MAG: ATP-binding protein [Elsteraceae bacterium]